MSSSRIEQLKRSPVARDSRRGGNGPSGGVEVTKRLVDGSAPIRQGRRERSDVAGSPPADSRPGIARIPVVRRSRAGCGRQRRGTVPGRPITADSVAEPWVGCPIVRGGKSARSTTRRRASRDARPGWRRAPERIPRPTAPPPGRRWRARHHRPRRPPISANGARVGLKRISGPVHPVDTARHPKAKAQMAGLPFWTASGTGGHSASAAMSGHVHGAGRRRHRAHATSLRGTTHQCWP